MSGKRFDFISGGLIMSCNSSGIYAFGNSWWWIIILIIIIVLWGGNNNCGCCDNNCGC